MHFFNRYFLTLTLAVAFLGAQAQYSLDFNGEQDHVVLNGTDVAPPWSMEVMVSKNETDNYQHLLTGPNGISGIRIAMKMRISL